MKSRVPAARQPIEISGAPSGHQIDPDLQRRRDRTHTVDRLRPEPSELHPRDGRLGDARLVSQILLPPAATLPHKPDRAPEANVVHRRSVPSGPYPALTRLPCPALPARPSLPVLPARPPCPSSRPVLPARPARPSLHGPHGPSSRPSRPVLTARPPGPSCPALPARPPGRPSRVPVTHATGSSHGFAPSSAELSRIRAWREPGNAAGSPKP